MASSSSAPPTACSPRHWPLRRPWPTPPPPNPVDYSRSTALRIFGLAAEIDFFGTATRALALRPSALKPAILARVARMAAASATWKPGQPVTILN